VILDTDALSAWADGHPGAGAALASAARLVVPVVVLGEYYFGVLQSRHRPRYEQWLAENLPVAELAVVGHATARAYGQLRFELKRRGTPIPANDAWIAALARQHDLPVLSNDPHFDAVPGIRRLAF
jgi:predicted nucleic acid-binding protein